MVIRSLNISLFSTSLQEESGDSLDEEMVDELLEKDVVRPEQENPVPLPVPTGTVMKVRGARAPG